MGTPVLIRLQGAPGEPTYTAVQEESPGQGVLSGPLTAAELAGLVSGKKFRVLVPSTEVLLTRVQLPKTNASRLARAIPYALEETIADEVEALHFVFAVERDGIAVAVVARSTLDTWLQSLRSVGVEPDVLIPDVLAVPRSPDVWSVLIEERLALVRTGDRAGFAAERETLAAYLNAALAEAKEQLPKELRVYGTTGNEVAGLITGRHGPTLPITCQSIEDGKLATVLALDQGVLALNLLQGAYAPRGEVKSLWEPWRASAALVLLVLVVCGATELTERARLQAATREVTVRIEALFRETFPETRRIINPKAQMEQQLQALRARQSSARGGFLSLLAEGGALLGELEGLQLERLDYQAGHLDLDLIVRDVQALDELKRALRARPELTMEILSATAADDAVRSRIRIARSSS